MNIKHEIMSIRERNARVEMDKKWEGSWVRRGFIVVITYLVAGVWLEFIHDSYPWPKAFVPAGGYLLSTLTLSFLKQRWMEVNAMPEVLKVSGIVVGGEQKGVKLGFPTINIPLLEKIESGIYAGIVELEGGKYKAAIYIAPQDGSVGLPRGRVLEAHLIGFSGDAYNQHAGVIMKKKIRDVGKFDNEAKLKAAIRRDVEVVRNMEM